MADKKFQMNRRVIDRENRGGIPNLRIGAWDGDLFFDDFVESSETDAGGPHYKNARK
jgi:hypothetical protein